MGNGVAAGQAVAAAASQIKERSVLRLRLGACGCAAIKVMKTAGMFTYAKLSQSNSIRARVVGKKTFDKSCAALS